MIEVLRSHKALIVVVNDSLMHNHQTELADALSGEQYLLSCRPDRMVHTLRLLPKTRFRPFPAPKDQDFRLFMDQVLFPER